MKTKSEKQWVKKDFAKIDMSGSLAELQQLLDEAKAATINGQWKDLELSFEDDSYNSHSELFIVGYRLESDYEFNARIRLEQQAVQSQKAWKASKKEKELKLLARLKAKYEPLQVHAPTRQTVIKVKPHKATSNEP